jgi:polyribonucleotide nucleotidyltransferase
MATVCGGVLSLMDAGVPLSMIVAGMAIGLIKENERYAILTDIAGLEDHIGDMDLKVAGTEKGITAIQLDLKIASINLDILGEGLQKARDARLNVLEKMKQAIPAPRTDISPYAPRILYLVINPEKVSEVIGPAGKNIKKIIAQTGAKIDIDETGKITIASTDVEAAEQAREMIREITVEAEVGKTYTGKVVRIEEYGAFVEILPNIVGLLHVSEIAHHRIRHTRDVMKLGQTVKVKVLAVDEDNKIKLSKKALEPRPSGSTDNDRPYKKKYSSHDDRKFKNRY